MGIFADALRKHLGESDEPGQADPEAMLRDEAGDTKDVQQFNTAQAKAIAEPTPANKSALGRQFGAGAQREEDSGRARAWVQGAKSFVPFAARLKGEATGLGTQLGESLANLFHPELTAGPPTLARVAPNPDAGVASQPDAAGVLPPQPQQQDTKTTIVPGRQDSALDNSEFTAMQDKYLAQKDFDRRTAIAYREYPGTTLAGQFTGASVLPAVAPLRAAGLTGGLARMGDAALMGGAYGAGSADKVGAEFKDYAKGGAIGAAFGIGAQGAGEGVRKIIEGAPNRKAVKFLQEVVAGDEGSATPTHQKQLVKDLVDVRRELEQPHIQKAVTESTPIAEGLPVIKGEVARWSIPNEARYQQLDQAYRSPMTANKLLQKLVDAEKNVEGDLARKALEAARDAIRNHWIPNTWGGDVTRSTPVSSQQLRQWLTAVQGDAESVMGGINGTPRYKVMGQLEREATKIVNDHFERAGLPSVLADIREANSHISALKRIETAMNDRLPKQELAKAGLGKSLQNAGRSQERTAAVGAAVLGHPVVAAAMVAKPAAESAMKKGARFFNDTILAPLEQKARGGATWAQFLKEASTVGIPTGAAQVLYRRFAGPAANWGESQ
jgi:hypothetical protein